MSLLGMRDMSVIETPPRDRLAINTQVVQFSEGVIRSAVELELARNGQIFFIHNRVETIDAIAALIQKIVPNARIAIGHGKMNEKEMEQVMLDFIDYKYDILVATTIIENGSTSRGRTPLSSIVPTITGCRSCINCVAASVVRTAGLTPTF
jgi:transcription-repair coupling factor (superfamily II helicase)